MADITGSQYPTYPSFTSVNFKTQTPAQTSTSFSGKMRRVSLGVSFYTWEVKYPQMEALDAGTVNGFLGQTLGQTFSFEIILPKISYSKSTNPPSTTVRTSATAGLGAKQVSLTNCGNTKTVLAAGDYFKFNNHSKVYMAVSPCTSNSSGAATLFFTCPLVAAVPSSTNLTITAVPFTAICSEDVQEYDTGVGGITSMSVAMREVW
jgi:hypothetical protein